MKPCKYLSIFVFDGTRENFTQTSAVRFSWWEEIQGEMTDPQYVQRHDKDIVRHVPTKYNRHGYLDTLQ